MTRPVDYDQHQHSVYVQGRTLPPDVIAGWMAAFSRRVPARRPLAVLDLGSGTGRFAPALADTFGGPVFGVEPSTKMRDIAEATAANPRITYAAGRAEQIPLPADSCDVVLMFLSLHHVRDRAAAAAEIARVLRPGGTVLIRSTFGDRVPDLLWFRYFPRARVIEQEVFPTLDDVLAMFAPYGVSHMALDQVRHRFATSLADYAPRLRLRAISTFEHLDAQETSDGFARLDADLAKGVETGPIETDQDLLTLTLGHPDTAADGR